MVTDPDTLPTPDDAAADAPESAPPDMTDAPTRSTDDGSMPATAPADVAEASNEVMAPSAEASDDVDGVVAVTEPVTADAAEAVTIDLAGLEALLFSTHHPLTAGRLAELLEVKGVKPIRDGVRELNRQYNAGDRSFRIEQVAGGYQMLTLPQYADLIRKHQQKEADAKLGKAALETLAVIAYKQPILRVNVEAVRGVACGETIRGLMEKHLVKIAGRAEEPGRPILYGTTKRFLEVFGLNAIKDLPEQEDALAAKAKEMRTKRAEAAATPDAGEAVSQADEAATDVAEASTGDASAASAAEASNENEAQP